jgi:hypothetical protein
MSIAPMLPAVLADLAVIVHLLFILFVVGGGLLVLRFRKLVWLHLPAAAWGAGLELFGWPCPLTGLEQRFRLAAMEDGYESGFVEHYLLPAIYPSGLTTDAQVLLGLVVLLVNAAVYALVIRKGLRRNSRKN